MNIDQINQELANLVNSGDPVFATAANQVAQMTAAAQAGQLSTEELAELLKDMQRQLDIIQDMSQLKFKETLNTIITGLLSLAAVIP
jgi:uncharacterized FlaG/YvyC family protein